MHRNETTEEQEIISSSSSFLTEDESGGGKATTSDYSFYYNPKEHTRFTEDSEERADEEEVSSTASDNRSATPFAESASGTAGHGFQPQLLSSMLLDASSSSFRATSSGGREALKRQIHLLELSLEEVKSVSDAKSRAFELQIRSLERVIADLKSQNEEKDEIIRQQKKSIIQLNNEAAINPTIDTPVPADADGYQKLNNELVAQNSQLRVECNLLKSKFEAILNSGALGIGFGDTDESESLGTSSYMIRGVPDNVKVEVERILDPRSTMLPRIHSPRKMDNQSQTDKNDIYDPSAEELIAQVKQEKARIEQSYRIEKDINQELIGSVQSLKQEISNLSLQFTKLSNDAEVALASERVALDQLDSLERKVYEKSSHIQALSSKHDTLLQDYKELETEYQLVKGANQVFEQQASKATIDPLLFLETQWTKDRHDFYQQTTVLKGAIYAMESENKTLKRDLASKMEGLPNQAEHARLLHDYSLAKDKIKKLESDFRMNEGTICALESQVLKLETLLDAKQKQVKDLGFQVNLLKKDLIRKQELVSSQANKISALENEKEIQESRARLESSMIISKEQLLKECRLKIKDLQAQAGKIDLEAHSFTSLQTSLRETKLELTRKTALVKQWKEKFTTLEKDLARVVKAQHDMVDLKQHTLLQQSNRSIKEKIAKLEQKICKLESRDVQFCSVITRFVGDCIALQSPGSIVNSLLPTSSNIQFGAFKDIDPNQVELIAQKLSKELLHVEWSEISMTTHPSSSYLNDVAISLKNLLADDKFEVELYSLLSGVTL